MRWPSCLTAVILLIFLTTVAAQRGSRRFSPSNADDLPEEDANTSRNHRFQSRDRSRSNDVVPRQDFPHRDTEVVPPTRTAPSRAPLRSRNEVSSRDSHSQKELPIVSSGAVEYERLQQPVETTRRSFTPRSQSSSSSNPPEVSRSSRTRGESSRSGPTERRSGTRFPKRDDDGSTVKPTSLDENVTRRSFSRLRGNPTSSSQTVKNPDSRQPATRTSFRNVPETVQTTEAAELRHRAPEATRSSKSLPDVRSRAGGRHFQVERGETSSETPDARSRTRSSLRGSGDVSGRSSLRSRGSSGGRDANKEESHSRGRTSDRFRSRAKQEENTEPVPVTSTSAPYVEPSTEPEIREEVTSASPEPTSAPVANPLARGASRSSSRGRGTARASAADLKTGGLKEKETDEVSDNDNYPEVYKQLVKSGTQPKDILVPKYKQLISKYAKKPQNVGSGVDSLSVSPRTPRVTAKPNLNDFKPKFTTENPIFAKENYDTPKQKPKPSGEETFKQSQQFEKSGISPNKYNTQNTPKATKSPSQHNFRQNQLIDDNPIQFQPDSAVGVDAERTSNFRKPSRTKEETKSSPKTRTQPKHDPVPQRNLPTTIYPGSQPKIKTFQTKESNNVGRLKHFRHSERDTTTKDSRNRHSSIHMLTFDEFTPTEPAFIWDSPAKKYKSGQSTIESAFVGGVDSGEFVTPPKLFRDQPKTKATTPKHQSVFDGWGDDLSSGGAKKLENSPKIVHSPPTSKGTTPKYQTTLNEWDNRFVNGEYVSFKPNNNFPNSIPPLKPPTKKEPSYTPPVLEPSFQFHDFGGRPQNQKPKFKIGNFQNYWNSDILSQPRHNPKDSRVSVTFNQDNRGNWGVDYSLENSRYQERNFTPQKRTMAERSAQEPKLSPNVQFPPNIHRQYQTPSQNIFGNANQQAGILPQNPPLVTRWGYQSPETQNMPSSGEISFFSSENFSNPAPNPQNSNLFNQNPILPVYAAGQTQFDVSKSNQIFETTYYGNLNGPVRCNYCDTTVPPTAYSVALNGRTFHKIATEPDVTPSPSVVSITPPFISRTRQNHKTDDFYTRATAAQETRGDFKKARSTVKPSTYDITQPFVTRAETSEQQSPTKTVEENSPTSGLRTNDIYKTRTTAKPTGDWNPYRGLNRSKSRTTETTTKPNPVTKEYNPTIYAIGKKPKATTPKNLPKGKSAPNETSNNIILNLVNIFRRFFGPPQMTKTK